MMACPNALKSKAAALLSATCALALLSAPASASASLSEDQSQSQSQDSETAGQTDGQGSPQGPQQGPPKGALPADIRGMKPVFDDTWVSLGIGAGLVPSYAGSDDYIIFPLPLIVGRIGGIGISPNGPGFTLNLNSPEAAFGQRETRLSFGPSFRIRNDRENQIEDEVVEQLEDLDLAVELGGNIGVTIPGVLSGLDAITLGTSVSFDVAGAHEGMLVEPNIGYRTPIGRGTLVQVNASAQFVDDDFADYYFSVNPQQSAVTGLPEFSADGGLNSLGLTGIFNFDLDGNALNGGLNIYTIVGYSRLVGDGADTPFTATRGSADQFIGGLGLGYTF